MFLAINAFKGTNYYPYCETHIGIFGRSSKLYQRFLSDGALSNKAVN